MNSKIIVTQDNSKTLLNSELNETYHSTNGAFNEAIHVFIEAGIGYFDKKEKLKINKMLAFDFFVNFELSVRNKDLSLISSCLDFSLLLDFSLCSK